MPSSGGSAQRVGDVLAHDASWMPDGKSVLYANENDLSVIRLDDGVFIPFARLSGRAFWMRWSPDGKLLRFTLMDPLSHATGIWELPSRGGAPHRLKTPTPVGNAACGLLSPDLAAGIRRVKGAKRLGVRVGNWLSAGQGRDPHLRNLSGWSSGTCGIEPYLPCSKGVVSAGLKS